MIATLIEFLKSLPPELATVLIAMIPITEMQASIPIAMEAFGLSPISAVIWSVVGDLVPATVILIFIGDIVHWCVRRSGRVHRIYERWVARTERRFSSGFARYGAAIALTIFVAIPTPLSGSWSGALASFLFGIPKRVAFISIFIGVCIAAVIVMLVSLGVVKLFF